MHPSLLSPRSKAACRVCRAYESGGGGQPPTQRDASGQPLKAEPAPTGAGARGCEPSARHRGGGFRAVASAARPLRRPCPHSLSGSRRCPHFIAPGRPAPGLRSKGATAYGGGGGSRPALWAVPPAPSGLRAAPLPALGGWSPPAPPAYGGRGNVAAKAGPCGPVPVKLAASVARGHLSAKQGQARKRAHFVRPCFAPPPRRLRRRCSGAARPPLCGGCGAVRPSGPVGGAPASLAARPRLRRWPCWQGSASASPPGVAAASPSPPTAA